MMKSKRVSFTPVTGAIDSICASQTVLGAVPLLLNGVLTSGGVLAAQTLAYIISLTSVSSDESGKTFLITGANADGAAQTETVTGPGAGLTVVSTKYFKSISSIVASAALTASIKVGTPNTVACAVSATYCLDIYTKDHNIAADISGTINYQVQKCYERPTAGETPNWVAGPLASGTVDLAGALTAPTGAIRLNIASYTNGATVAMSILPARSH